MLESLIASIDEEAKIQTIKDERFVREQRILDESAPRLWRTLRAALKAKSEKYPKHFTFRVGVDTEAVIVGQRRRVLEVQYLKESKTIAFTCNGADGEWAIRLDELNRAVICGAEGVVYSSLEYASEQLLAHLLRP